MLQVRSPETSCTSAEMIDLWGSPNIRDWPTATADHPSPCGGMWQCYPWVDKSSEGQEAALIPVLVFPFLSRSCAAPLHIST
jgi:hypothetical protein